MISVCIITRNERDNLKECLRKLSNYDVELVVVDTGSTDDSISLAKQYTESVYEFAWCDDFAAARNYAAKQAKHDIVMMIDTDEFAEQIDIEQLQKLVQLYPDAVGRIHRKNQYITDGMGMSSNELVNRIYNKTKFCYEGIIHEQIVPINGGEYTTYPAPVYVEHSGYLGGDFVREKKAERNLKLLFRALQKNETDPYLLYQIGKSYYFAKDYEKAVEYLGRGLDYATDCRLEYVIDLVNSYGYALINSGNVEESMLLEGLYIDFCQSADFLFMLGNVYMQNARFDQAIEMFLEAANLSDCVVEGVNSYLAYYNIGVIYECIGRLDEAIYFYKKCGKYKPAQESIKRAERN